MILRAILIAVLAASPAFAQSARKQEAPWTKAFPATLITHVATLPPIKFSPELSVEENNARLDQRDPTAFLLATINVETQKLAGIKDLVGRTCSVQPASAKAARQSFDGEVFAFTLSEDRRECTLYVRVANQRDASGKWQLASGQAASLKVALLP